MADQTEKLSIIIDADGARLSNGMKLAAEDVRALGKRLDESATEMEGMTKSAGDLGTEAIKAGKGVGQLAGNLADGDWRGAATNFVSMGSAMGPLAIGLGLAAAAAFVFGKAMSAAHAETERQANALLLTGNYAGLVSGQLNQMARDAANGVGASVSNTRATMEAMVGSGRVTTQSLTEMAQAVELVTQYSGRNRAEVVKDFTSMASGVASWAAKHNEQYHFITFEQYKYIESLEKSGQAQEAMRVTSEALNQHLSGTVTTNLGTLEKAWLGVKNMASLTWDAMLGIGRERSSADRIAEAAAALAQAESYLKMGANVAPVGGGSAQDGVNRAREELEAAQEVARLERRFADDRSQRAQEAEAKIAADRKEKKTGVGDVDPGQKLLNTLTREYEAATHQVDKYSETLRALAAIRSEVPPQIRAESLALAKKLDQMRIAEQMSQAEGQYLTARQAQRAQADAAVMNTTQGFMALKRSQEQDLELLGLYPEQIARVTFARKVNLEVLKLQGALAQGVAEGIYTEAQAQNMLAMATTQGNAAIEKHLELLKQQEARLRDPKAGMKDALHDYSQSVERVAVSTKALWMDSFKGAEDALMGYVKTGKLELGSLFNFIGDEVARMQIRESMTGPLAKALAGIFGGGGDTPAGYEYGPPAPTQALGGAWDAGVRAFAKGGTFTNRIVSKPTMFAHGGGFGVMGEAGPEAIMPLKRGADGSLGVQTAGGGAPEITVNVYPTAGQTASVTQKQTGQGLTIDVMLRQIEEGLAGNLSAGAGPLARSMEGRYGLRTAVN